MAGRLGDYEDGRWTNLTYLPCNAENGFVPAVPEGHVDVLYLCYPNNPTGTTLTKEQLKPFVDYAREHGAVIVYDAAYKAFITLRRAPLHLRGGRREGRRDRVQLVFQNRRVHRRALRAICRHSPRREGQGRQRAGRLAQRPVEAPHGHEVQRRQLPRAARGGRRVHPRGLGAVQETVEYYRRNATLIRSGLAEHGLPGVRRRGRALRVDENPRRQLGVFRHAAYARRTWSARRARASAPAAKAISALPRLTQPKKRRKRSTDSRSCKPWAVI